MVRAVEKVRRRLLWSVGLLENLGMEYALSGDHAVVEWIASVDPSAVRSTPEVELLIRAEDVAKIRQVIQSHGYLGRRRQSELLFVDTSDCKVRKAIQFVVASESASTDHTPSIQDRQMLGSFWVLTLEALVRTNLARYRTLDRLRLRDLIDVGLVDSSWISRLPADLARRLQQILDTPEG